MTLTLPKGWRQREDISWRASSWGLRRMALGGVLLESVPPEQRKKAGLPETGMVLRAKYVGQGSGPHGTAFKAGIRQGDVIVSFDGRTDLLRETDVLAYGVMQKRPGDVVTVTVLRGGKRLEFRVPVQK